MFVPSENWWTEPSGTIHQPEVRIVELELDTALITAVVTYDDGSKKSVPAPEWARTDPSRALRALQMEHGLLEFCKA